MNNRYIKCPNCGAIQSVYLRCWSGKNGKKCTKCKCVFYRDRSIKGK